MPQIIDVVGVGPVEFPDEMQSEDILGVLQKKFPKPVDVPNGAKLEGLSAAQRLAGSSLTPSPVNRLAPAPSWRDIGQGAVSTLQDIVAAQMQPVGPAQPSPTRGLSEQELRSLPTAAKIGIGATEAVQGIGDILRTPFTYETLGLGPVVESVFGATKGPLVNKALATAFAGQMTAGAADKAGQLVEELKKKPADRDTAKILQLGSGLTVDAAGAGLAAAHAATPEAKPPPPEIGTTRSTSFPPSKARPVEGTPSTIKEAAPVIPETKPQTEGEQNASAIPIPASVPQPEVRTPVGQKPPLRQQGEVAGTQGPPGREEPLRPPGSGPPQGELTPQDLTPALKLKNGDVIRGEQGVKHNDIIMSEAAKGNAEVVNEPEHGFVDKQGNFFSRRQASDAIGEKDDLHSERLAELQKPAVKPENVTTSDASSKPSAAEGKGKKLPNPYLKDAESSFEHDIIGRMESEGRKINASTLKGVGKDFAQRIRDIRKLSSARKIIGTSGGQSLDEIADDMGFESTDELLDAIEGAHKQRQTMREQARQRYAADIAHAEASKTPALELAKPESVEEAKTRVAAEEKAAKEKDAKQEMLDKAAAPLSGGTGDLGQGDLLGGGDLFSNPKHSMGGATEADPAFSGGGDFVSNMFAAIDRDRKAMGKPPMPETQRRTWDEDNQRALAQMRRDPTWIPSLIADVAKNPRPLLSWEQAGMVWERNRLKAEAHNAAIRLNTAFEDGRQSDMVEAKQDLARYEDEILSLDDVVGRNGTGSEAGRSLQAQKMGAGDDFSLVEMRLEKRGANGGKPLTKEQDAQIATLYKAIEAAQEGYDKHVRESQERESSLAAQLETERAKKDAKIPAHVRVLADRIRARLDKRAADALKYLQGVAWSVGPEVIIKLADIGASKILSLGVEGAVRTVEWTNAMVDAIGEKVKPYLDEVWEAAQKAINEEMGLSGLERAQAANQRIREMTPEERIAYSTGKLADKLKEGKNDSVSSLVQTIGRQFVKQNPNITREELVAKIHGILEKIAPGKYSPAEARDMFSGYGDFKQLPKDTLSTRIRDLKGQLQQVAKLEAMQGGKPPLKTGLERRVPTPDESRLIKAVNDAKREFQIPITDPDTQLKSSLDTLKARLTSRIREYEDKLNAGDFAPKERREIRLDNEAIRLKAAAEKAKQKYLSGLRADRLRARSLPEKAMDATVKWSRGFLLSGPSTLAKLTAAAFWRGIQNPVEELVGSGLKRLPYIKQVAERAPIGGRGFNVKAESVAVTEGFMQGLKDSVETMKSGKSVLDRVFGNRQDSGIGELDDEQKSVVDFFGHLHGALKAPVKRAAFARAFEQQAQFYMSKGVDVADPAIQTKMAVEAYKQANRDIFMQPNRYADRVRRFITSLEEKDKLTGRTPPTAKAAATVARVIMPIVKVPTNIVGEAIQYATGLVTGSVKTGQAFRAGIDQLKPEQADLIMRELKKGGVGTAALLLGYFLPNAVGGFYQQGEKRSKEDVKYGGIRVFGHDIPKLLLHTPLIETLQLGATVSRVADSKLRKKDLEKQGISEGMLAGALGLADDVPFIENTFEASKLMNPHERGQWLGELVKSRIVPQMLSQSAEYFDKDANGNPIKRDPKTIGQHIESGIPGLRETVPVKKVR